MADYERGMENQREIATRHGISPGTLQNWLRRQRSSSKRESDDPWIEVVAETPTPAAAYWIEFPGGRALVLGNGWRPNAVLELLSLLSRP